MKLNGKTQKGLNLLKDCESLAKHYLKDDYDMAMHFIFIRLFSEEFTILQRHGAVEIQGNVLTHNPNNVDFKNQNYLITDTALKTAQEIKGVNFEKFDLNILRTLPNGKKTFLLGNNFFRYTKEPMGDVEHLICVYDINHIRGLYILTFPIDIESYPEYFEQAEFILFLQLLCFIELSGKNVELKVLVPNSKIRQNGIKILNDCRQNIIIVNSKWNITTISVGTFPVRGHLRLQPCGKNWSDLKLVCIAPYMKHGITRRAHQD